MCPQCIHAWHACVVGVSVFNCYRVVAVPGTVAVILVLLVKWKAAVHQVACHVVNACRRLEYP